jgi:hypothetical protein
VALALALERRSEERLGGSDVSLGAKQEIDGLSLFVDSAVKIRPTAPDFDVGLIDAPGPSSWASEAVPVLLELRHIALDPAHDRRMRQGEPALGLISARSRKLSLYRRYQRTQIVGSARGTIHTCPEALAEARADHVFLMVDIGCAMPRP